MKYLFHLLILISVNGLAQTYNVPVKSGDAVRIRKNSTNVITLPTAGPTDSNYKITLVVEKKNTQPVNKPPVVTAGNNQSITLPANSVTLSGTATDADGTIVAVIWNNATALQANIVTPASTTTTVTDLVQGSYIFRLTATDDKGVSASASVNVTVNGIPPPPDTSGIKLEGFGANAVGGSNSTNVYHVTNTNSSGSGSLSAGIGSNKTIVFDVSGTIVGRFDLIGISYLTIDGGNQDITINNNNNGDAVSFDGANTHHCILKNIHVTNAGGDGINMIDGAHDITVTNCTSWGNRDGNIDVAGDNLGLTKNVTVQWCILGGGAANNSSYSGCMLITGQNVTDHHNLFVPATVGGVGERCALVHCNYSPVGNPNADIINTLVWKFGRDNGTGSGFGIDIAYGATGNAVNNYVYTTGGSNSNGVTTSAYGEPSGKLFASGNVSGNSGTNANAKSNSTTKYPAPAVTTQDACTAARLVLAKAGPAGQNSVDKAFKANINLPGCQ